MKQSDRFFIAIIIIATVFVISINVEVAIRLSAAKAEITQLKAKLAYWECTAQREPEQPPAPVEVGPTLIDAYEKGE